MTNNVSKSNEHSSDEDEPPPLPPPRLDSLNRTIYGGLPINRPLPTIPNSTSCSDLNYDDSDSIEEVNKFLNHSNLLYLLQCKTR